MRYALRLEFDGSGFCGWQAQGAAAEKNKGSLQALFQKAIRRLLDTRKKIIVHGCGRTDAGVHAQEYVAHVDIPDELLKKFKNEARRFRLGLNSYLPEAICVKNIVEAPADFHALNDVVSKVYEYRILIKMSKPALELGRVYWMPCEFLNKNTFDLDLFQRTLQLYVGTQDFASFASSGHTAKTTVRTIYSVECLVDDRVDDRGLELRVRFHGKGFLKQQVRNMMGAAIATASKKRPEDFVSQLLKASSSPSKRMAGLYCAPPEGLFLMKVEYDRPIFSQEKTLL